MTRICPVKYEQRIRVPAIVHIDGTARPQTVTPENGQFFEMLLAFESLTGIPMVVNTSLNIMGEPMAETPDDALKCLTRTDLDACILGKFLVTKE
jgi:carbamoyltransferase